MAFYTLILLKKFAVRPRGEAFFIAKGGKNTKMKCVFFAADLISEPLVTVFVRDYHW